MFQKAHVRTLSVGDMGGGAIGGVTALGQKPPDYPLTPVGEVGQVTHEGNSMEKALSFLSDEIDSLEASVGMILKPLPPAANGQASAPTPLRCQIADGLAEANRRISYMAERLREIRQRVDL
jgi:hypothetical protein